MTRRLLSSGYLIALSLLHITIKVGYARAKIVEAFAFLASWAAEHIQRGPLMLSRQLLFSLI